MKTKSRHKKVVARLLERERKLQKPVRIVERPMTKVARFNVIEESRYALDPSYTEFMQRMLADGLAQYIMKNMRDTIRIEKRPDCMSPNMVVSVELEIVVPKPKHI